MGDRNSNSSYDGEIEEANVAMKMDAKTMNQLSSSGKVAQQNRGEKAISNLQNAIQDFKNKEHSGDGSKGEGQEQSRLILSRSSEIQDWNSSRKEISHFSFSLTFCSINANVLNVQ